MQLIMQMLLPSTQLLPLLLLQSPILLPELFIHMSSFLQVLTARTCIIGSLTP
jgi:hypothetical protein